jgi:hypothetical protein
MHLSRKTSCLKPFTDEDSDNEEVNQNINITSKCKFCNKVYSRDDSLLRHINNSPCKNKKELDDLNTLNKNTSEYEKYPINIQLIDMIINKSRKIEELNNKINDDKKINDTIVNNEENINKMKESSQLVLNDIVIIARKEDNFINATQLCLAGNKLFADWYRLNSTKELIKELEMSETGIPVSLKAETRIRVLGNSKKAKTGIPILENPDMGIHASGNFQDSDTNNQISENFNIETNDNTINYNNINNKKSDMGIHISQNPESILSSKFVKITKGNSSKFTQGTWIHPRPSHPISPMDFPKICFTSE